ncbi:hypothetical protein P3G55_26540, partial [Leptospira sp. 96542]|nr:hypothetical protein [Leptospira sp. 96542]
MKPLPSPRPLARLSLARLCALACGVTLTLGLNGCALTDELAQRSAPKPALIASAAPQTDTAPASSERERASPSEASLVTLTAATTRDAKVAPAQATDAAAPAADSAIALTQASMPALALQPLPKPLTPATHAVIPLAPPDDLWQRIRQGFTMPDLNSPLVPGREQWYAARPEEFIARIERSRMYLF